MYIKNKKALIDDGCCPELVLGSKFDGIFEIPIIERPNTLIIPKRIVPFTARDKAIDFNGTAIGFYEMDPTFSDILKKPDKYVDDFLRFSAIISVDASLYRDAPLAVQITNIYKSRAIGSYYQRKGAYVIPQIRWGSEETYTTKVLPEKVAFLGACKNSIVSIGTYGCIKRRDDKYHFKAGLESMLETLEPEIVLVYGSMPDSVFGDYLNCSRFIQYDDWISAKHGGDTNGK